MQRMAHDDGELATARACKKAGVAMGLSSFATTTLEDVATELGDTPHVLQLYLFESRSHSKKLLARAKKAGYKAVFLTVDTPMLGRRNLEIRNQFKMPSHLKIANFADEETEDEAASIMDGTMSSGTSKQKRASASGYTDGTKRVQPSGPITFHTHAANPTLSWENDIEWLKKECGKDMQVWVKGIATGEDALLALHHGVDGIVVSNHGGRQLNGAMATLDALPDVVEAVGGKIPVHVDGGIRHGSDVFKALALGADFVWIGRPVLCASQPSYGRLSLMLEMKGVSPTKAKLASSCAFDFLPMRSSSAWRWPASPKSARSTETSWSSWTRAGSFIV